jgi:pilus assembly protein Flp/PilA
MFIRRRRVRAYSVSCGGQGKVQKLKQLIRCNKGATAIEYAILAALVATAAIAAFIQLGDEVEASFNRTSNAMGSSTTTP